MSPSDVRVYFPTGARDGHYVYQVAHETPPDGVTYLFEDDSTETFLSGPLDLVREVVGSIPASRSLYNRLWRGKDVSQLGTKTPGYDVYHNRSVPRRRSQPWVQECEHVGPLLGKRWRERLDNESAVERVGDALASPECKAIMPHTEAAAESIRRTIPDSERFEEKLEPVPLAYDPPENTHLSKDDEVRFLFVGSSYFDDQFYIKGGDKVLRAYERIREDIDARLVVRSDVPEGYRDRYSGYDDINLVTDVIPRDELEALYEAADVFVFPSAQGTPGAVFREAMGYALAIVGLDIWGNDELVADGETGFLVKPDTSFQYVYPEYHVPVVGTGNYFRRRGSTSMEEIVDELTSDDEGLVQQVAEKMRLLAEDDGLRRRQELAGRERIINGDLSLAARNEKLGRIYRNAATE